MMFFRWPNFTLLQFKPLLRSPGLSNIMMERASSTCTSALSLRYLLRSPARCSLTHSFTLSWCNFFWSSPWSLIWYLAAKSFVTCSTILIDKAQISFLTSLTEEHGFLPFISSSISICNSFNLKIEGLQWKDLIFSHCDFSPPLLSALNFMLIFLDSSTSHCVNCLTSWFVLMFPMNCLIFWNFSWQKQGVKCELISGVSTVDAITGVVKSDATTGKTSSVVSIVWRDGDVQVFIVQDDLRTSSALNVNGLFISKTQSRKLWKVHSTFLVFFLMFLSWQQIFLFSALIPSIHVATENRL